MYYVTTLLTVTGAVAIEVTGLTKNSPAKNKSSIVVSS